jgi:hypothetical protein
MAEKNIRLHRPWDDGPSARSEEIWTEPALDTHQWSVLEGLKAHETIPFRHSNNLLEQVTIFVYGTISKKAERDIGHCMLKLKS